MTVERDPKQPWQSRLWWLGILTLAISLLTAAAASDFVKQYPQLTLGIVALIGLLTVVLRHLTDTPIKFAWLAPALCLAFGGVAEANWSATEAHPAVVRVRICDGGGCSCGSGALIENGIVVSAAHVLRGGIGAPTVTFASGQRVQARVLVSDEASDVALLQINPPAGVTPLRLADADARRGDRAWVVGYGPAGRYRLDMGEVAADGGEQIWIDGAAARSGDSGGPVVNERGEIVGLITGVYPTLSNPRETMGPRLCCIRQFLRRIFGGPRPQAPSPLPYEPAPGPIDVDPLPPAPAPTPTPQPDTGDTLALQRLGGEVEALKRELDLMKKRLAEFDGSLKESTIATQRLTGIAEAITNRLDLLEQRYATQEALAGRVAAVEKQMGSGDKSIASRLTTVEQRMEGQLRFKLKFDPATGELVPVQ